MAHTPLLMFDSSSMAHSSMTHGLQCIPPTDMDHSTSPLTTAVPSSEPQSLRTLSASLFMAAMVNCTRSPQPLVHQHQIRVMEGPGSYDTPNKTCKGTPRK